MPFFNWISNRILFLLYYYNVYFIFFYLFQSVFTLKYQMFNNNTLLIAMQWHKYRNYFFKISKINKLAILYLHELLKLCCSSKYPHSFCLYHNVTADTFFAQFHCRKLLRELFGFISSSLLFLSLLLYRYSSALVELFFLLVSNFKYLVLQKWILL